VLRAMHNIFGRTNDHPPSALLLVSRCEKKSKPLAIGMPAYYAKRYAHPREQVSSIRLL
jgi:hypothetical protein